MEVAEIFVSARPSYFIDESDNFIPRVDEGPIPIFVEKNIFGDFVAIILLSSLAAMIVLLLLLLRKMYVSHQVKTIWNFWQKKMLEKNFEKTKFFSCCIINYF